jgi:hypothetical protein
MFEPEATYVGIDLSKGLRGALEEVDAIEFKSIQVDMTNTDIRLRLGYRPTRPKSYVPYGIDVFKGCLQDVDDWDVLRTTSDHIILIYQGD